VGPNKAQQEAAVGGLLEAWVGQVLGEAEI